MSRLVPMSLALAFAAVLSQAPTVALARHGSDDHPSGHHSSSHHTGATTVQTAVSRDAAVTIARDQGVARVREVKLRDGHWEIEGWVQDGRRIEVDVHAGTGDVLKRETYAR